MSKSVTHKDLNTAIKGVRLELGNLDKRVEAMEIKFTSLFSNLQTSVERYLKKTQDWNQESIILKARHNKLSDALVAKGIVSQEEISL